MRFHCAGPTDEGAMSCPTTLHRILGLATLDAATSARQPHRRPKPVCESSQPHAPKPWVWRAWAWLPQTHCHNASKGARTCEGVRPWHQPSCAALWCVLPGQDPSLVCQTRLTPSRLGLKHLRGRPSCKCTSALLRPDRNPSIWRGWVMCHEAHWSAVSWRHNASLFGVHRVNLWILD